MMREKKLSEIDNNISNMNEFLIIREKYTKLLDFYFLHYDYLDKINNAHRLTFDFYYKEASRYLGEKVFTKETEIILFYLVFYLKS